MIVVFLEEEVIVPLDHHTLVLHYPGKSDLLHELVVELGTLVDQPQLCQVTFPHAIVQCPLHQKDHQKPVKRNQSEIRIDGEQPDDGNPNREGNLDA